MKKLVLMLTILVNAGFAFAQKDLSKDYSYTVSEPYKVFDGEKFYFSKDNQVLTVKVDGREVLIQKLNSGSDKISFISEKKYEDLPKNVQVEDVLEYNDKYYFFYSSWDGGDVDKEQLFSREIDFKTGQFVGEGKLLFKVDGKVTGSPKAFLHGISLGVHDKFDFLMSLDKKRMLIQYRKKPEVKRDTKSWDVIGMVSYDQNMVMTSSNEVKMPYTERRMDVFDYAIDGEGTNYILAKVFHDDSNDDKKRRKDEEANYHVELFRLKSGAKDLEITKIEVKDKFINGLWVYEMPDGKMVCAGYYNIGKKVGFTDGMIIFKVGKEGAIYDLATYEIPVDVLNEYTSDRTKRRNNKKDEKGEAEFPDLRLKELLVDKDGSLVLIGEQTFTITHYSAKYTYVTYHYESLLINKIDASGKMAWMKKIPKRQRGNEGRGGMSYKHMYANGSHYLMFLDNVKNYSLPLDKGPAEHTDGKGGYFTSYKINNTDGSSVNSSVFNMREVDDMTMYQFATSRIVELTNDSFAVEFYKKKKEDVMIKVKMK